jgi:hypothetical protein
MNKLSPTFNALIGQRLNMSDLKKIYNGPIRLWQQGSVGTMDYCPDRLNVHVDKNNIINRINFG